MISIEKFLEAVEQVLLSRQLSPVERLVLRQSWSGQSYGEIAENCAYGIPHIKEIGSQLWHDLSEALGERVTKKNLRLVVNQYQQNSLDEQHFPSTQEFQIDIRTEDDFPTPVVETALELPGRPLPLDSPLYINRPPIEELVYTEISQPGCLIRIKAPRMMGKSSLLKRLLARATALGYKIVYLDFREADQIVFASLEKFLRWLCVNVSKQLNLKPMLDDYWDEDMGSKVSCKIYFEAYLFKQISSPLVLALNEVNQVFEHPTIAQDFLPMLRSWHEQGQQAETWKRLRLVVVHTTEIYIPLKLTQSPFNVGLAIKLPQFTLQEVQDLAVCYGLDWTDNQTQQLMAMVGGHPYLVSVALYHLSREEMTLEELLLSSPTPSGIYSHHLRGYLTILREEPQLASDLQQVVTADQGVQLKAISAYKLESMGLIQVDGNQAQAGCELYRLYFRKQLGEKGNFTLKTSHSL